MRTFIRICLQCGKQFTTTSRKKKLCSDECKKEHKSLLMSEKCKDKEFITNRNNKIKQARNTEESKNKTSIASKQFWSIKENKEKVSNALKEYNKSEQVKLSKSNLMKERYKFYKENNIQLPVQKQEVKDKIVDTLDSKFGRGNWPCNSPDAREKANKTAEINGSWGKAREKGFETISIINKETFISKGENEVKEFVESLGFKTERKYIKGMKASGEIDIFIPQKNIGIEFNGSIWHSVNFGNKSVKYHFDKTKLAKEQGIELIHVWEDLWHTKKDLVKTILKHRLGKNNEERIFARKCEVKEIDLQSYKDFCIKNHIQGYRLASVKLGLFYNGNLVQIASFAKTKDGKYDYEWIRGCPASNNSVIGGTSKIFKYFVNKWKPKTVLCYADLNLFNGDGYKKCGFILTGLTGPNKFYVKGFTRIERNPKRYHEFKELVKQKKILLCYGAGSMRFVWSSNFI